MLKRLLITRPHYSLFGEYYKKAIDAVSRPAAHKLAHL